MLSLLRLRKTFPDHFEPTLKTLSLDLTPGTFCVLIGSNGSGKSTLLRAISGECPVESGSIQLNGKDLTHCSLSERAQFIASVVQETRQGTIEEMSLLENWVLSRLRTRSGRFRFYTHHEADIRETMHRFKVDLEAYLHAPLRVLSGGQRQLIATCMALSSNPQVLLLDEHTSALDPKIQTRLMALTAEEIQRQKLTTIMVTHRLDDAIRYGDRLIMLHQGSIVLDVMGEEKHALSIDQLVHQFHQYEDRILHAGEHHG